ncbi:hypothetical protein THAOC_05393 [Thalassiosira oceanica]|uniref:Uncharacterized protein n=1 Tax=Thalassiosira oceanica TaxID=159749 RepID=K0T2X3_THAOC|nr:hypothetical protein THAOC_05393 [Thalassiosira oceanica]|eukprot:EJK73013.1 hypothetical protein THAOC_05393 [Thalassiosira oceanica]
MAYERSEGMGMCPPTRVDEDGFLRYCLAVGTILAVKVSKAPSNKQSCQLGPPAAWHELVPSQGVLKAYRSDGLQSSGLAAVSSLSLLSILPLGT